MLAGKNVETPLWDATYSMQERFVAPGLFKPQLHEPPIVQGSWPAFTPLVRGFWEFWARRRKEFTQRKG